MCPCRSVNHIFNGLVEKMMDDLGSNFLFPNNIIGESIEIFMWKLNKVYDICIQSLGDKENQGVVQN